MIILSVVLHTCRDRGILAGMMLLAEGGGRISYLVSHFHCIVLDVQLLTWRPITMYLHCFYSAIQKKRLFLFPHKITDPSNRKVTTSLLAD